MRHGIISPEITHHTNLQKRLGVPHVEQADIAEVTDIVPDTRDDANSLQHRYDKKRIKQK